MIKQYYIIIALLFSSIFSFSQGIISGKILDSSNNQSMVGVTVYIPELQKGTFSDKKGNFILTELPQGEFNIQFTYLGYKTHTEIVVITKKEIKLDITLEATHIYTQEVVITAMGYTSQHDNAIKVESIKIKELNSNANINIMDKLDLMPGVTMITQGPGISSPNIRGLSLSNVLVLNNGFRMNNYQFSQRHPYLISNYGIDKVEIIKGPASLLYGSDAVGGVINFISEKPAAVGSLEGDINAGYYSNTRGYESNIGIKAHGKKHFWGIRLGMQQHADFQQGNNEMVPNSRFNDRDIQFNTGINNNIGSFTLRYNYKTSKIGLTTPQAIFFVNDKSFANEMWYQDLDYHQISSHNKFFFKKAKLESNFSYQTNRRRLFGSDNYIVDMRMQNIDYEFKLSLQPSKKQRVVIGIQGNYTQNIDGGAPIVVIPNYFQNDFSLFSLLQQDIGTKVHLQAGIRYDFRNINIPIIETSTAINPISLDTNYHNINFTLGGTYELTKEFFIRVNLASAYRTPNVAELTQEGIHETRYERGNIHLESQKSYESDLGVHYHSKKLSVDMSIFYNQIGNYIYLSPTADTTSIGMEIYQYGQTNAALYGLEAGINYVPSKYLNFKINYTYTEGKQQNGNYLPLIPQNRTQASITINFKDLVLLKQNFFELSGVYAFAQNNISEHEQISPSYFLLNSGLGTTFTMGSQKFILGIYANNILNTKYMDHLSSLKEIGYYNMGRNISLKISVPFGARY